MTRVCTGCGEPKSQADDFYESKPRRCKECIKAQQRAARAVVRLCMECGERFELPGSRRKICLSCAEVGRVCARCGEFKPLDRFYKSKHARYCRDGCALAKNRETLYGLRDEDHKRLLAECGGRCPACGRTDRLLVVDHCHDTGAIRGLLCGPCNSGLGLFGDSPEALRGAVAYLERWGASNG